VLCSSTKPRDLKLCLNPSKGSFEFPSVENSDIAVVGLRGRTKRESRFPGHHDAAGLTRTPPLTSRAIFPHFANGGGFTTEFVMYDVNSDLAVHDQNGVGPHHDLAVREHGYHFGKTPGHTDRLPEYLPDT